MRLCRLWLLLTRLPNTGFVSLALFTSFLSIGLIAVPLVAQTQSDEEALFLRRIADFWQEGEYTLAKSQIEEFLTEYPESIYSDALSAALGDLYLREKNYSTAIQYYSQVKTEEFFDRVFLKRMQCLYEMQWYATLADECESFLEQGPNLHATYFLAIALYHQCLNAIKEPEGLQKLAARARPYFETLSQSELSNDIAQGFAHLCCIMKDYEKASQIYQSLADKTSENREELLFQVALIQAEYDKSLSIKTFGEIAKMGGKRSKEAAYNQLILSFDTGHYEDLAQKDLLKEIPQERVSIARLFLGRSLLHLKKYPEAIEELKLTLLDEPLTQETLRGALVSLLEASYQSNDLGNLDFGIEKLNTYFPQDSELPKALFSRGQIFKILGESAKAEKQFEEILSLFPDSQQKPQILFELAHLDYRSGRWETCANRARDFLSQFPQHELAPFAWRYLISSSAEVAPKHPCPDQLISDLEDFLKQPLSELEKGQWRLLLAKTYYELKNYEKAISLLAQDPSPNGKLLYALCIEAKEHDLQKFASLGEEALKEKADLIRPGALHTALYNAYIELNRHELAAEHLFSAFQLSESLSLENLLWLSDIYFTKLLSQESNFPLAEKTESLLLKCQNDAFLKDPDLKCKAALHLDFIADRLAKVYLILGKVDEAIHLLQNTSSLSTEGKLLLAESYARKGITEKALELFDSIVTSSASSRSPLAASASLQGAKLKLAQKNSDLAQVAKQLKNLVLQKTLVNEPIYLEAALDYIELQAKSDLSKKLTLSQKTKSDFEKADDLLSKDYHEARLKLPEKDKIYQSYMRFLEAQILAIQAKIDPNNQKDLQAKSKDLLLQIVNEPTVLSLRERALMLLNSVE